MLSLYKRKIIIQSVMKKLSCILLITILFVSCKTIDNELIKKEQTTVLFELIKGGCYGTCPIYNISVDENRQIKYEGKRFVDAIGTYNWIMNEKDFKKITSDKNIRNYSVKNEGSNFNISGYAIFNETSDKDNFLNEWSSKINNYNVDLDENN